MNCTVNFCLYFANIENIFMTGVRLAQLRAPADCIWGGGRAGFGEQEPEEVLELMQEYGISARLTFSNSLLREEHLSDKGVMNFVHYLKRMWKIKRLK